MRLSWLRRLRKCSHMGEKEEVIPNESSRLRSLKLVPHGGGLVGKERDQLLPVLRAAHLADCSRCRAAHRGGGILQRGNEVLDGLATIEDPERVGRFLANPLVFVLEGVREAAIDRRIHTREGRNRSPVVFV